MGGTQLICLRLARQLGRRVVLRAPVTRIVQGRRGVRVESKRLNVRAKRVIVAIPPTLAGRIDYSPEPPGRARGADPAPAAGDPLKVDGRLRPAVLARAGAQRAAALSLNGPVTATFDDSPPDGSPGVLFGFVGGDEDRRFLATPRAERRAQVLENFASFFGAEASDPLDYFETNWPAERWSRGGPVGVPGPGVLVGQGSALRRPIGRIHWAGTETSTYWNGYMDGAVRSGERAAREVLDRL